MFKQNSNPVLNKVRKDSQEVVITDGASYIGVILKTGILFAVMVASAVLGIVLLGSNPQLAVGLLITSLIVALIAVFVASLVPRLAMPFSLIYAAAEGFILGMISLVYAASFPELNIIPLALMITFGIFGGMLVLYSTKLIVVSNRFKRVMLGISFGILFTFLVVFIVSIFDGGATQYLLFGNANSPLVLFIAILFVFYGAFMLVWSFDDARNIVVSGAPKHYEWLVGLGLVVSTVYIYLQVLRLIAILASRD